MQRPLTPSRAIDGAIGPFDDYCDGYGNPGSSGVGYVSVLRLSTGTVAENADELLEEMVAGHRAETSHQPCPILSGPLQIASRPLTTSSTKLRIRDERKGSQ